MSELGFVAMQTGADQRTLYRAARQDTIRTERLGGRRTLAPGEMDYLVRNWNLIAELRKVLRTERCVRLAVLFGSYARGSQTAASDLDLMVKLSSDSQLARLGLAARISERIGTEVEIVSLKQLELASTLRSEIAGEGRVLIDREAVWQPLRAAWIAHTTSQASGISSEIAERFDQLTVDAGV